MYEQHFELTDRPFGSTPDPTFYFDSRGHRRALAYLRYATREGDSLILLTGDIGTGKTTLVCKLLGELNPKAVASAHLVSTQLNALDLLMALIRALGGSLSGRSKDELRAALQSFLATLTATGRKALVVIDEAQNLLPDALAEITDLARAQLGGSNASLQIMLVGHPELGRRLPVGEAEGARRLIFLACHIGPLVAAETRAYIEHRLRRVHWHGSPSFSNAAFLRIHQATDGVPRRINRLCDRLLLAACLHDLTSISAELVAQTDAELNAELDGLAPAFDAPAIDAPPHAAPAPAIGPSLPGPARLAAEPSLAQMRPPAAPPASAWGLRPDAEESIPTLDSAVDDMPSPADTLHAVVENQAPRDEPAPPMRPSHWHRGARHRPGAGRAAADAGSWRKAVAAMATLAVASLLVLGAYRSGRYGAPPMARDAAGGATGTRKSEPDASRMAPTESPPRVAPRPAGTERPAVQVRPDAKVAPAPPPRDTAPPVAITAPAGGAPPRETAEAPALPSAPQAADVTPIDIDPRAGPPAASARRRAAKATPPRGAETTRPASPGAENAGAAQPPPAPGPCTAAVAALGLCNPASERGQE